MIKILFANWTTRFLMILFWLFVLVFILFVPKLTDVFDLSDNSINVYCWVDVIDFKAVKQFEKETGINVNFSFYEQNYELFSKLKLTKGKGYDLIMVTDFLIDDLVKEDLLQPLDKSRMPFWIELEPALLNKPYDPENVYTIPYIWDIYTIGYRKDRFKDGKIPNYTFDILLNPAYMPKHILMVEEANEAIATAIEYKFGDKFLSSESNWKDIKEVLLTQKKNVEAYSDLRAGDLLISGAATVAYSQSAYICKAQSEDPENIGSFIPKPRSFVVIDGYAITKATKKLDQIYKFINFNYSKKALKRIADKFMFLPARKDVLMECDTSCLGSKEELLDALKCANLFSSFKDVQKSYQVWMQVKSS